MYIHLMLTLIMQVYKYKIAASDINFVDLLDIRNEKKHCCYLHGTEKVAVPLLSQHL